MSVTGVTMLTARTTTLTSSFRPLTYGKKASNGAMWITTNIRTEMVIAAPRSTKFSVVNLSRTSKAILNTAALPLKNNKFVHPMSVVGRKQKTPMPPVQKTR